MASERFWRSVFRAFTANGTANGAITVVDARGFKVKAEVVIKSNTLGPLTLQIKNIPNSTTIEVGPASASMDERSNLSGFLVSDAAAIHQPRQKRPSIGPGEIDRATYEEEPTVARRTILVDEFGEKFATDNPVPVRLSDGSINIGSVNAELEVALSHKDNTPNAGDVADSVRIGDGTNEMQVDDRFRARVTDLDGLLAARLQLAVTNANFLKLANYSSVVPEFRVGGMDFKYYEDGALIGKASIEYDETEDWSVTLDAYLNDDDGSLLQDDDDSFITLD